MEKIGKFDVIEMLGRGAMGVVYKGHDPSLARHVAIKVMTAHLEMDPELRARFFREAQAAGSLQHPNIITVYELGDSAGQPYIAMEFVPGRDLDDIIEAREPLTIVEKVDIIEQVCRGLAYAHERQIVHRDVKPANIRVTEMGQVKLMDFGVAHLISSDLTQTGSLMGTPYYMAPEVVNGQSVDMRADIFSLGATFYELLSYTRPFQGESLQSVFRKILHSDPAPLRELGFDVPPVVQKVLDRSLAKNPRDRYSSTGDFLSELMQFWETVPAPAQARLAATTSIGAAAAKTAARVRRRWTPKRIIPAAIGAAVLVAGLAVVGGAVVWPRLFGPPPVETSVENGAPAGAGGDETGNDPGSGTAQLAVANDSALPDSGVASGEVEGAAEATQRDTTAAAEASQPTRPARQPSPPVTVDRGPYNAARAEADRARDAALAVGADEIAASQFQLGDALRERGLNAARRGRYSEARSEMVGAREAYSGAQGAAERTWTQRLDSARSNIAGLSDAADPGAPTYSQAGVLVQRADSAQRAGDYNGALQLLAGAADAYRDAERVAVSEPVTVPDPPKPSASEIVDETLGRLRAALESEDLASLRQVWVGLGSSKLQDFEDSFEIMEDLKVGFAVRSLQEIGDRITVTVQTSYDFVNEGSRRRETLSFSQTLELEERNGRWVVVGSRS